MSAPGGSSRWYTSPGLTLTVSALLALAGTAYLVMSQKTFGALAFGGANLLALLMWIAAADRMARVCRMQSAKQAVASWVGGTAWSAGVVALYRVDEQRLATILLCVVLLLYTACAWLLASGRMDEDLDGGGPNDAV